MLAHEQAAQDASAPCCGLRKARVRIGQSAQDQHLARVVFRLPRNQRPRPARAQAHHQQPARLQGQVQDFLIATYVPRAAVLPALDAHAHAQHPRHLPRAHRAHRAVLAQLHAQRFEFCLRLGHAVSRPGARGERNRVGFDGLVSFRLRQRRRVRRDQHERRWERYPPALWYERLELREWHNGYGAGPVQS